MAKATKKRNDIQHVFPLGRGWAVKGEMAKDFFIITITQSEAVKVARKLAQTGGSELVIHSRNGRFANEFPIQLRIVPFREKNKKCIPYL